MTKCKRSAAVVVPVALLLVAAACGGTGKADKGSAARAPETTTTSTTEVAARYPLTGMPAVDAAKAARPAVAVKIDNNAAARPQAGLDQADVIYEEFTEGITRFIVIFQSSDAAQVGPVRSVRPADPNVVKPLGGPLAFSGGSPAVLDIVRASGVRQVTENDTDTLRRRSDRSAPHNLYTSTDALFRKAGAGAPPPVFSPFLAKGAVYAAAGAAPVSRLSLSPAPGVTATYQWDGATSTWTRSTDGRPHALEGGAQVAPRNVIVQYTPYTTFPADKKVRFPEVVGSGDALVFVAGTMVKARWTKSAPGAVTTYADTAGTPIPLAPGQTWVHLMEPGSALTAA